MLAGYNCCNWLGGIGGNGINRFNLVVELAQERMDCLTISRGLWLNVTNMRSEIMMETRYKESNNYISSPPAFMHTNSPHGYPNFHWRYDFTEMGQTSPASIPIGQTSPSESGGVPQPNDSLMARLYKRSIRGYVKFPTNQPQETSHTGITSICYHLVTHFITAIQPTGQRPTLGWRLLEVFLHDAT